MVITMAKLRMAHESTHGARKLPGPKEEEEEERLNDGDNNGQATHGARKPPEIKFERKVKPKPSATKPDECLL